MSNMSYCRFENTYRDLLDCYEHLESEVSESEHRYRLKLIEVCDKIVMLADDYGGGKSLPKEDDDDEAL